MVSITTTPVIEGVEQEIKSVHVSVTTGTEGPKGDKGDNGKSAYQQAVDNGFVGTLDEWLASLKGTKGDPGNDGSPGSDGKSAYQEAVDNGFVGTEDEWLASLKGIKGDPGADGAPGADGTSAYQEAVDNGFVGTKTEWLASLVGAQGDPGVDGKSAYQEAVDNGFVGTETEWLASLVGPEGPPGSSSGGGLFRGEWATTKLLHAFEFSDNVIPSEFTKGSVGQFGVATQEVVEVATTGLSGAEQYVNTAALHCTVMTNVSWIELDLSTLGLTGITTLRVLAAGKSTRNGTLPQIQKNGTVLWSQTTMSSQSYPFAEHVYATTEADVWRFENGPIGTTATVCDSYAYFTGIEIYGAEDPYSAGEYVVHSDFMWRCLVDGTAQEPSDAATDWVKVPLVSEGMPVGGTAGQMLAKVDEADFNTEWVDAPTGGSGGSVDRIVNTQTGTAYALAVTDDAKVLALGNTSGVTLTIPASANVAIPVGAEIYGYQSTAGRVTFNAAAGVTLLSAKTGTLSTSGRGAQFKLLKVDTDTWVLSGDLFGWAGNDLASDSFAAAPNITALPYASALTNNSAFTTESGELGGGNTGTKSGWWKYTPSTSGVVNLSFTGTSVVAGVYISVWSGNSLTGLTQVLGNTSISGASTQSIAVTAGTTYYFRMTSWQNGTGTYALQVVDGPTPASSAAAPRSGETVLLKKIVLAADAASVSFTAADIPTSGYDHLQLLMIGRTTVAAASSNINAAFNGDLTLANYISLFQYATAGQNPSFRYITTLSGATATHAGISRILIPNYRGSFTKESLSESSYGGNGGRVGQQSLLWSLTDPISTIDFTVQDGSNFQAGTVFALYGIAS